MTASIGQEAPDFTLKSTIGEPARTADRYAEAMAKL